MDANFYNPVKILSGAGCLREYTGFADFGRRCMIVCGASSARRCGALSDAEAALAACGVEYTVFDRIEQNPLAETCHAAGAAAREWGAEF
ncbi:MAG: iron-containing alcohol dehydrogenase, partial [Clostridia bacterium]|nr:iron-containing alcohol dehydrogenase [Clostridia bacterium]